MGTPPKKKSAVTLVLLLAAITLLAFVFADTVIRTAKICLENDNYSHGVLLPFVTLYLLWDMPRAARSNSPAPVPLLSIALLVTGVPMAFLGFVSQILFVQWVSLFVILSGAILAVFGSKRSKHILPPILLLFLAKPIPDALAPALFNDFQSFAAATSAWLLDVSGVPVYLRGNIIELPGMRLNVEEACSGIRSLLTLTTVAIVVVLITRAKFIASLVLLAAAVLFALLLNIVRVTATGILARQYGVEAARGFFHSFSGIAVFVVGLLALYGLAILLERRHKK